MQGRLTDVMQDLHNNDLGQDLHTVRTSKTAPWNSCKICIEGFSRELKRALCQHQDHRESAKIRSTPRRERSDKHKVPRERCQKSPRATTRAIWHAKSQERALRVSTAFLSRSVKYCACHRKWARPARAVEMQMDIYSENALTTLRCRLLSEPAQPKCTRKNSCKNLQQKCRGPGGAPWSNPCL